MTGLGLLYYWLYGNSWRTADLGKAIFVCEEAVGCTSTVPWQLALGLSSTLQRRFSDEGDVEDIDRAIQLHQNALSPMKKGYPYRPLLLSNLGNELVQRFNRLGKLTNIENAILSQQKAVAHARRQTNIFIFLTLVLHLKHVLTGLEASKISKMRF